MFWFCILITIVTYPLVCAGSLLGFCFLVVICSGHGDMPNPFVSPAKVYRYYRATFENWVSSIKFWYREENGKKEKPVNTSTTHYHPVTGMRYRLRADGRYEFKQVGLKSHTYPEDFKFRWEISGMTSGFISTKRK